MNKEKMERIALLLILGLGLGYIYLSYFFFPQWQNIQKQKELLGQRQAHLERLQSRAGNMLTLQKEIQELELKSKELEVLIPGRLDKPAIMADLYTLAKAHHITPENLAYGDVQSKSGNQELPLTLICSGSPENILRMVSDIILRSGPKLAVQAVNLSTQDDGIMRAELKLISYATVSIGGEAPSEKPSFMNASFGVDNAAQMFQPPEKK